MMERTRHLDDMMSAKQMINAGPSLQVATVKCSVAFLKTRQDSPPETMENIAFPIPNPSGP